METARFSDASRGDPHTFIRMLAIYVPCGHGRSGCQLKDKRVFRAFRLSDQHEGIKLGMGKAQPMLTRVGGGRWIVPTAGPDLVFGQIYIIVCSLHIACKYTMSYQAYDMSIIQSIANVYDIVHDIYLQHRTRHMPTTSYTTCTYDIVHDMHIQTYNVVCIR
jgi:hypothetical protein